MIAAYQLALDCGLHPRHVLIEIDGRALGQRAEWRLRACCAGRFAG